MKVIQTNLEGCFLIEPTFFKDHRGCFLLEYNKKEFQEKTGLEVDFVLENQSTSQFGVIRGLHLQRGTFAQAKLVRVVKGKILDVVVDARKDSKTFGKVFTIELSEENNTQLFVPKGFLHGFSVLENNTIVAYKCDNYYNVDAEDGVIYNDVSLNIDWKLNENEIILSEKDMILEEFSKLN